MRYLRSLLYEIKKFYRIITGNELSYKVQINRPSKFYGSQYGGFQVYSEELTSDSIVYSVGIGEDISFDLDLIESHGPQIYAFDPTPKSIEWVNEQELPPQFHFLPYGIAAHDGTAKFYPPENPQHVSHSIVPKPETHHQAIEVEMKRLETAMAMLGHDHIDLLKLDVEGAEFDVIEDLVKSDISISQILVEFHHRFEGLTLKDTRQAIGKLQKKGYRIFVIYNQRNYGFLKS